MYRCVSISWMAWFPKKCPTDRNPSGTKQETRGKKTKNEKKKSIYWSLQLSQEYHKYVTKVFQKYHKSITKVSKF